ncbi:MAG: N-(5'-phosphoribosyl)anthranilate isomerase, partial [Verrucomicrobia bacterium]|nr:N-(5'-phosphoribosyl)anthranilate isomerase [Verrucomicrobiota bacterium]
METRIKICGITNAADAKVAVRAGADALGFIFYEKSPRAVTIKAAAEISEGIPGSLLRVGVFVNAAEEEVRQAMAECA